MEVGVNVLFFERKMNGSEWKGNGRWLIREV